MILNGDELKVVIERKRIKNVYMRINENNEIYVTCSKWVSEKEIYRILERNRKKLEKMYIHQLNKNTSDEKVLFLGDELKFVENKKIIITDDTAYGPNIKAVNEYLEKHSLSIFKERLDLYVDDFKPIPKFSLRVRKMKTRWGVNNRSSETITLNTLLIHKDTFLIDYVIVHELSHFKHMDHSKRFWDCVESHYPEYKLARKELRD